jgi:hypothetical protein
MSFLSNMNASVESQIVDRENLDTFVICEVDNGFNYSVHGLGPVENVLRQRPSVEALMLPLHLHSDRLQDNITTVLFVLAEAESLITHSLLVRQLSPPLVSTTMTSLPNELWCEVLRHAISLENNLAMVEPSSERLYPFFPGSFSGFGDGYFYSSQLAIWKRSKEIARNFVQVNRLWRGIAERFLYSAFYVEEEWRVQRFIDTVKLNPNLSKQLHTLVIMPPSYTRSVKGTCFDPLVEQVLSLCHGIVAIVSWSTVCSASLPLFQSLDSSRRLLLLSAVHLQNEEFPIFMINFNNYSSLQVLELSVVTSNSHTLPSFPQHITFPSLHSLVLGCLPLDLPVLNVIGKWELPSLKELSIYRWYPLATTPLLPLIQRSYERLKFFSTCLDLLHDLAFHDMIRAPPFHLRNLTLNVAYSPPPTHLATKPFFGHVVTLGIANFRLIKPKNKAAWVRFFSDPTYMPHLRSVLTDATKRLLAEYLGGDLPLLDLLRSFEKVLEDRGVAFKGVMDDYSSFVPIKILQRDILEVSVSLFGSGSMLTYSPASKCSSWELRALAPGTSGRQ